MKVDWLDILNQYGSKTFQDSIRKTMQFDGGAPNSAEVWGDIVHLDDYAVPDVPECFLPKVLQDIVVATAQATETPTALAMFMILGALSRAATGKFKVETEPGFFEWVVLYLMCVLPSGNRKTAVLNIAKEPLEKWERERARELEPEIQRAARQRKNEEALVKKLRNRLGGKTEDPDELYRKIEEAESNLTPIPRGPRLFATDITPERLATLMQEQGECIGLVSDEGGIFDTFGGRYSNGIPNLDLYLKAYDGSSIRVDRQSAPPVHLKNPLITTALCPQPSVLEALTKKPEFRNRGLVARFLYATPRSPLGARTGNVKPIPTSVLRNYEEMIFAILNFEPIKEE